MIEIIPINYGKSVLPESMIFENGAENKLRPIIFGRTGDGSAS